MNREVEALIDELFTPASREDVVEQLGILREEVKGFLKEVNVKRIAENELGDAARTFVHVWESFPRAERVRLIVYLVLAEAILRRLERQGTGAGRTRPATKSTRGGRSLRNRPRLRPTAG